MKKAKKLLALLLSVLLLLSAGVVAVSAENGTAVIEPVASNIVKRPYTIPTASSGDGANAKDDDVATAWTPAADDAKKELVLDFAGTYDNLRKIEVEFAEEGVYQYKVEASTDKVRYEVIADRSSNKESAKVLTDTFYAEDVQYIRLTLLNAASVAEVRVFNYLPKDFMMGSDISYSYTGNNFYSDATDTTGVGVYESVASYGLSFVRLRIWNIASGNCSMTDTLDKARRIFDAGMELGIDFHYGDTWCDPQHQGMPKAFSQALTAAGYTMPDYYEKNWNYAPYFAEANEAWAKLTPEQQSAAADVLAKCVYDFTYDCIKKLVDQGTVPSQIQIGNEITNGILWPVCQLPWDENADSWQDVDGSDPSWDRLVKVLNAGTDGAKAALPEGADTQFVLHTTVNQGTYGKTKLMLEEFEKRNLQFDVLGISYYPTWHGTTAEMEKNLNQLCVDFPKYKIQFSETAYGSSGNPPTDRNFPQPLDQFPMTVQGQANFLLNDYKMINDLPDGKGIGVLYWELVGYDPMYKSSGWGSNAKYVANASMHAWSKSIADFAVEGVDTQAIYSEGYTLPATAPVRYSQGEIVNEPVVWDEYDEAALKALPAGEKFVITGVTESGISEKLILSKDTAFTDTVECYVDEPMTFTVQTDASVSRVKVLNENGRKIGILALDKTQVGNKINWNITVEVGTPGERVFSIVGNSTVELAKINVKVKDDAPAIISAEAPESVLAGENFNVVVRSSDTVKRVKAANESGRSIGLTLVSKNAFANAIDWTYEMSIGTAGERTVTFSGTGANNAVCASTSSINVNVVAAE